MREEQPTAIELHAAQAYARAWRGRAALLETERLRDLRALSERDAARRFVDLLQGPPPGAPRPSSGLVEQQRILSRLRRTPV